MTGYDRDFLGLDLRIDLPTFDPSIAQRVFKHDDLRERRFSDHIHYTLVMNEDNRQLIYSAYNIDQTKFPESTAGLGSRSWRNDPNFPSAQQLGNKYYKDRTNAAGEKVPNPYDKGHMVMRLNTMWGDTIADADQAGKATYVYANSSLQHENLNRDEWKYLEMNIVRKLDITADQKLSVFTGPIYGNLDRHVNLSDSDSARVPSGFFKVICFRTNFPEENRKLGVLTFAIFQDEKVLRDRKGSATVKTDRRYQITISELRQLTGINFGQNLFDRNPLFFFKGSAEEADVGISTTPERIPIQSETDLISDHAQERCEIEPLQTRKIIIDSAMVRPTSPQQVNEWVTVFNRGAAAVDLNGWQLKDRMNRVATLSGSIEPGTSLKLSGDTLGKVKLADSGGSLMLFDEHGCVIDHVTWSRHDINRIAIDTAYMFERGQ